MRYHLLVLGLVTALGACTTATVDERRAACQAIDWPSYGETDGRLGVAPDERQDRFADCAELGYPADVAAYQAGRMRGLEVYCTVENGYQVGYDGRRYRDACPPELEVGFLQGYEQGRKDRPVTFYPSIGFGIGFGHFGYGHHHYFHNNWHHGHYSHRRLSEGKR